MREDQTVEELLDEIIAKRGPYKRDALKFAESVIENSSQLALEVKKRLLPVELVRKGK